MKTKLYQLQQDMTRTFAAIKDNPMDLNRIMVHIANMSQGLDMVITSIIGTEFISDLHMTMLGTPNGEHKPQVSAMQPWLALGRSPIPGSSVDLGAIDPSKLHFWADPHFMHRNIIKYSNRPYDNLEHMHVELLNNYKSVVAEDDVCVWVGDVSFGSDGKTNEWLDQFPGYKILVVGNHDIDHGKLKRLNFDEVHTSMVFDNFIVSHHPWYDTLPQGMYNIHGHTHDRVFEAERHIGVSVERINYVPISMLEIAKRLNQV